MLEKEIENHFVWAVERMGGKSWKFTSPGRKGVSDRIACLPDGSTWFVELKRPKGGVLSPLQAQFQSEVVWLKQKYALLHTKELIDEWKRTHELHHCITATP
jgi:hypothetical protein